MALTASAAIGAGLALATYLDGKYQLKRDAGFILRMIRNRKRWEKAIKNDRISPWYVIEDACEQYPNNIAIWSRQGIYTYAELHDKIVQYARWLLREGIQPGELVSVYLQNSPEFFMVWYACLCIGAAPAFINYNLEGTALLHCLNVAESKLLIVDEDAKCQQRIDRSRTEIEKTARIVVLDQELKGNIATEAVEVPGHKYRANVKGEDPVTLIYTSGTTGLPKGVPYIVSRFHLLGFHITPPYESVPGVDRWYNAMPLYHGTGAMVSTFNIVAGVGVAIAPKFSVSGFWPDIYDSDSTAFIYVGETARYLLNAPPHPLERKHRLRLAHGNGLRPDVWTKMQERFNIPQIAEFFNSSEGMFGMVVHAKGPYLNDCVGHHGLLTRALTKNVYIPVLIDHETGDIWRDPTTGFAKRVPHEKGGEILVAIPDKDSAEFPGYWRSESATKKKYIQDVFKKGDLYYRTGDALRRTPDGHWYFMDRLGDTYRWKSENVSTAEVAQVIGSYPGISEANVYGVLVPNHEGRAGCAAIHIDPNTKHNVDFNDLLRYTQQQLPKYAVPVFWRLQKAGTHIHNYKQNKVPLRKEGIDPNLRGTEAIAGKDDTMFWVPPKKDNLVVFIDSDWTTLSNGKIRL